MTKARRFAHAKDAAGKTVIEFMCPAGDDDSLSVGLRLLTQQLVAKGHGESGGGMFGGEYGYGVNFENDVFLMHRFCWCEADDCLWCGGSSCRGTFTREPHRTGCYQERIRAFAREHGELLGVYDGREHYHVPYGSKHQKKYDSFKRALCKELKQDYKFGNETHCTCGVDAEWQARYDVCQCDWHLGRGQFRFGAAVQAPNFWHKPSGLQVRWYKYIGRDNEVTVGSDVTLGSVLEDCLRSIGCDSLKRASKEYGAAEEEASEQARKAMEFAFSDEGRKMFDEMVAAGAIQTFGFGGPDDGSRCNRRRGRSPCAEVARTVHARIGIWL